MNRSAIALVVMTALGLILGCAGGEDAGGRGAGEDADRVIPPSPLPTTQIAWTDVTQKYKDASLGNVTIKGNDQWEPIVDHVVTVEYDKAKKSYRVYMDLPGDDLRRQLPGIMMTPGIGGCMTIQFWDSKPNGIAVYGSDGEKATEATGSPGICQDV